MTASTAPSKDKGSARPQAASEPSVVRNIVKASSALGLATGLERGLGFLANLLAARLGGAGTFGAYSLALTTANNIASYAGGGIGSTATRFSGEFAPGTAGHSALVRALAVVSVVSASLATVLLWFTAGPLASWLLANPRLEGLLQWAALSSGAMVLLECCRGFFIGQKSYRSLLLLSLLAGASLLSGLPVAALTGPAAMVITQASAILLAVLVCVAFASRRKSAPEVAAPSDTTAVRPTVREMIGRIWSFGLVQLAGIIGLNAAGWWIASLVARADTSLVQMGMFAVANQLRNMAALPPGLLTQSSFGMLAQPRTADGAPHERVLTFCTFAASFSSTAIVGGGVAVLPWLLPALYRSSFSAAVLPGCFALLTAIVHMSNAPASARLSIVSLQMTGIINAVWAVLVAVFGFFFVPAGGAAAATALYLALHGLSAVLVLAALGSRERLPAGLLSIHGVFLCTAGLLAALAAARNQYPDMGTGLTAAVLLAVLVSLSLQIVIARKQNWVPRENTLASLQALLLRRAPVAS